MGTKYKLTYFDDRCRGEPVRMIFFMRGVEFEDIRVNGARDWTAIKHTFPLKQLPVLQVNEDVIITQTRAIIRYLGREYGFYGQTNLEGAQIDCVMDVCEDVIVKAGDIYHYQGPGQFDPDRFRVEKKDVIQNYNEVIVPGVLTKLQTLFEMNKSKDGYFVGDQLSIADLYFFAAFDFAQIFKKDMFDGFPKMAALYNKIMDHEKVAEWLRKTNYTPSC